MELQIGLLALQLSQPLEHHQCILRQNNTAQYTQSLDINTDDDIQGYRQRTQQRFDQQLIKRASRFAECPMSNKKPTKSSSSASPPIQPIIYCYNTPMDISPDVNTNLLSMLTAIIHFAYAIENVWITALMISFQTPNMVDAFVWIIPNIIAILIRPYLHRYTNLVQITMIREAPIVMSLMLIAGSGCLLVGLSTNFLAKTQILVRIVLCSLGWTMMDAGMELTQQLIQKMNDFLNRNFETKPAIKNQTIQTISSVSAYVLVFIFLGANKSGSLKLFYSNCKMFYYFTGWLAIIGAIIFKVFYQLPNVSNIARKPDVFKQHQYEQLKNVFLQKHISSQFFLPGLYQFKGSSITVKILLLVHFCIQYLSDIMLIYGTMWFVIRSQAMGITKGISYSNGMRDGSLALATFTLVQHYIFTSLKNQNNMFGKIAMISGLFVVMGFNNLTMFWIYGISISLGICVGYYRSYIQPCWQQMYPVFETCQQLIQRVQKIFVLCVMPFVSMIILERDDITDCIGFGVLIMIVMAYSFFKYEQDMENKKIKNGKTKFR